MIQYELASGKIVSAEIVDSSLRNVWLVTLFSEIKIYYASRGGWSPNNPLSEDDMLELADYAEGLTV